MHIRTFLKPLSFIPAILIMYMIFTFSAQTGEISSSVSYKASRVIVQTADNVFDMGMDYDQVSYFATKINGVTRKLAHMTEYFLLAIAVSFPLYVYGLHGLLLVILAGGLCVAFACGDEYHQSFVAGRGPSMKDVGIDSVGILIGVILVRIIGWTGRMTIFRPIRKDGTGGLSRKQKKALKKQQHTQAAYYNQAQSAYPPYPNTPYPNNVNGSYPPNPNGAYMGGPGQNTPYPNPPYPGSAKPYQNVPYPGSDARFQNGSYPGNFQQGAPVQNKAASQFYRGSDYEAEPYPQQTPPQYMGQSEHTSDELDEDMPLSHIFQPKKRK